MNEMVQDRMNNMNSRESELELDLESGGTTSEEDRYNNYKQRDKSFSGFWSEGSSDEGFVKSSRAFEVTSENVELLIDKNLEVEENGEHKVTDLEKKRKKRTTRKAPKPPRPPKGPSLDAADHKLVREIAELAMRRRARMERIKTLKKTRAAKSSSWNSSLSAMIITLLFLVIIFHGICSKGSPGNTIEGSPAPAVAISENFISVHFYKPFQTDDQQNRPSFGTVSSNEEHVSSSGLDIASRH